jgi:hypothetical protein
LIKIRIAVAGSLWLASAGAGAVSKRRGPGVSYPALLAAAAAVTAAVLADELQARQRAGTREDQVTNTLAALEIDRRMAAERDAPPRQLGLVKLNRRLPGRQAA